MPQGAEESSELPALELGLPVVDMLQVVVGGQGRNVLREVWRGRGVGAGPDERAGHKKRNKQNISHQVLFQTK
jgi:hypothetical protein